MANKGDLPGGIALDVADMSQLIVSAGIYKNEVIERADLIRAEVKQLEDSGAFNGADTEEIKNNFQAIAAAADQLKVSMETLVGYLNNKLSFFVEEMSKGKTTKTSTEMANSAAKKVGVFKKE